MEKIVRNYLEIKSLNELVQQKEFNGKYIVERVSINDFQLNKFFYKQIGKDYRWIDRLAWGDNQWINYVENAKVKTYVLKDENNLIGFFELIFHFEKKSCEIAYFGVLKEYFGKKYGGFLLSEAIKNSFNQDIKKVWVHTCTLDHKNALKNYIARGMKIFKSETVELDIN